MGGPQSSAAAEAHTITRDFDAYGRLVRNGDTCYAYAPDGLLATVSNAEAFVEYAYTSDRLDAGYTLTLTNGTVFSRTVVRDAYRRALIVAITNSVNGVPVETFTYAYDALGRPTSRCRGVGGSPAETDAFGYNARSEVVSAIVAGGAPSPATACYGYDEIGNSTNWSANCLNQYTLCGSVPPCEFSYDLDGSMLSDGTLSFTYDAAHRLASVSSNDVVLATFPIAERSGVNLYAFCGNNAVNCCDHLECARFPVRAVVTTFFPEGSTFQRRDVLNWWR